VPGEQHFGDASLNAVVRDKLDAGMTPDQIYRDSGNRRAAWLIAIEEEARRAGVLGATPATPEEVAKLRDGENLRWERIAARVFADAKRSNDVRDLYDEAKGTGASRRSYTGRGRRVADID
jgi:hypothetical protein